MTLPFAELSLPEIYEQALVGPLFRPFAELILDEVELTATDRVLDVACGTGIVARVAKERLGDTGTVVRRPESSYARRGAPRSCGNRLARRRCRRPAAKGRRAF
jgi:hypothetical protein